MKGRSFVLAKKGIKQRRVDRSVHGDLFDIRKEHAEKVFACVDNQIRLAKAGISLNRPNRATYTIDIRWHGQIVFDPGFNRIRRNTTEFEIRTNRSTMLEDVLNSVLSAMKSEKLPEIRYTRLGVKRAKRLRAKTEYLEAAKLASSVGLVLLQKNHIHFKISNDYDKSWVLDIYPTQQRIHPEQGRPKPQFCYSGYIGEWTLQGVVQHLVTRFQALHSSNNNKPLDWKTMRNRILQGK